MTASSEHLRSLLERAEAACGMVGETLQPLAARRVEVLKRAVALAGEVLPSDGRVAADAFARGAVWTEVNSAGRSEVEPLWRASVAIYLGSKGWSTRSVSEPGSIRGVVTWAHREVDRLRRGLAMQLMIERHAGAERGVPTVPRNKVRTAYWGVNGVL